jgi:hypothetical protein
MVFFSWATGKRAARATFRMRKLRNPEGENGPKLESLVDGLDARRT